MQQDEHANSENTPNLHYLLACSRRHCWGSEITLCTNNLHVACPSPTVNTLPLFCLTSPWYRLSVFSPACLVFFSHRVFLPVFRCKVSGSDHMADILERTSLYSCQQSSCGCTSCISDVLVWCAVQLTLGNRRYAVISKPCIRLLSTAFSVQVSHPYSATVHTNADKSLY